jgi:hypothetical protein
VADVSARPEPVRTQRRSLLLDRIRGVATLAVFGVVPLALPVYVVVYLIHNGSYGNDGNFFDLNTMWNAGRSIAHGHSPYPFIYPAPAPLLMVPFGLLPWRAAVVAFFVVSAAATFTTLRILGVRDWRCYGACAASLPTASALWIGTPTPLLALATACAWRWRDRRWVAVVALTGAVATKIFLWPLFVWLLATRRYRTAIAGMATIGVAVIGAWGMLGFSGLSSYPRQLVDLASVYSVRSYSMLGFLDAFGVAGAEGKAIAFLVAAAALALVVLVARRPGGDAAAFSAAIAAAFLISPIVWVHYLVLLFVPIAIVRPRLTPLWLLPLALWPLAGQESGGSLVRLSFVFALLLIWIVAVTRDRDQPLSPGLRRLRPQLSTLAR